ncbi:nucleoside 2-deoxyribosyltransferase [Arthrobacter phage Liebe]|uniref:Nucleoside deoxyribosyltransferase n=2 Tax=Arthrobacter virus Liebe TaxID=2734245 RepID=A0A3G2KHQ6_9CAUD|nr:nucleoside 2-deoxyribosyltransferase [Arthrobacter phage Liebe]AYN58509.1 nucleoside deoxyribosyltransferase [Arthrobacter phage Maureen]AZF93761.1 nucleoside deoxyribosyltransferase [Arthrobacter phage Liebe]
MKLYLAGPMSGYEEWNYPAFLAGAERLRAAGYDVVSPAEIELAEGFDPATPASDYTSADYYAAMRRDIALILDVDGVALLPGWDRSKGARVEAAVASAIGIPARVLRVWVDQSERIQADHVPAPVAAEAVAE